jgi:hypothetical protein
MKETDTFNRQTADLYIQNVINLLEIQPNMFDLSHNGTTQKNFTIAFMDGIYPLTLRQAIRDRGPETIRSAIDALSEEFVKFTYYDEIRIATCKVTSSST